jgi:UDP-glucose 4-epimerase
MQSLLSSKKFDAVMHFAAKALIPESITDPAAFYKVNMVAATTMLDAVRNAGIKRIVFSSTAAVYGNPIEVPITEDHPKNPVNSYGETKLSFERLLAWYSGAYGLSVCAFRYFSAAGATECRGEEHKPETHLLPLLLEAATGEREHFTIYGTDYPTPDGTCIRDFVHVLDIAQAHILALQAMTTPFFRAFNIGLGKGYSIREVHLCAEEITGRKIPVVEGSRRAGDPAVLCASPELLKSQLGWKPRFPDLRTILESAWQWKANSLTGTAV